MKGACLHPFLRVHALELFNPFCTRGPFFFVGASLWPTSIIEILQLVQEWNYLLDLGLVSIYGYLPKAALWW